MGSPAFNPSGSYSPVAFDPKAAYDVAPAATPAAPKSLLDRAKSAFDAVTTVTPEQEQGHSALFNKAQEFGAAAIQGAGAPIVHPLDTLNNVGTMIAHPIDSAKAMVQGAIAHPAQFAGNLVGGAVLGEGAGMAARAVNGTVSSTAGRAALLGKTPEEAYEAALKPSVTADAAQKASAVRAGLENAVPISKAGVDKVGDLIDALNKKVADTIDTDPTRPIDPNKVATRADIAKAKFAKQVNAGGDLSAIEASKQQFLQEQGAPTAPIGPQGPAPPMNAVDAQAMKQGTYKVLTGKFGEQGSAAVEAQKALARGLKEEIASQFPEISGLNAQESRLLDLQPLLERAVNRANNQGMFRLGTGAVAGTVKALGGTNKVAAVAAVMKQVLDDPAIKARVAIAVSKGGKIPYVEALSRVGAYSSALGSSVAAPQGYSSGDNPNQSTSGQP